MKLHSTLLCVFVLLAFSTALFAGECFNATACSTPCPAEFNCYSAAECPGGDTCMPACESGTCSCDGTDWICTDDCAGICSSVSRGDADGDGIPDNLDNCPLVSNPAQFDADLDGIGDACDPCPTDPTPNCSCPDIDNDGVCDPDDNCPTIPNPGQEDCDNDGLGDACEVCPCDADEDIDGDAVCGDVDNCPFVANPAQIDTDGDGLGDACDCDPVDPTAGSPTEVAALLAHTLGGNATRFDWQAIPFADRYDILQGRVGNPNGAVCITEQDPDPTDLEYVEATNPPPGECRFYLIRGVDDACGGSGPWGGGSINGDCP